MKLGLGLRVGLRPTDPSLAALAVDRRALLLDEDGPKSIPDRSYSSGMGRGGGHGHAQPSSDKLSSLYGKGEGW